MMYCHWSFLNWSRLVPEIEAQLYAKYGITKPEQKFIESMVKPIHALLNRCN